MALIKFGCHWVYAGKVFRIRFGIPGSLVVYVSSSLMTHKLDDDE